MHPQLVQKLIDKGAIRQGTSVEIRYQGHGLSCLDNALLNGEFIIEKAVRTKEGALAFYGFGGLGNRRLRFGCDAILLVDGMDFARIARTFDLTLEGDDASVGKRRGRKRRPVTRPPEISPPEISPEA